MFKGGREGTLWYYTRVVEILQAAGDSPLVDELSQAVSELEQRIGSGQKAACHPTRNFCRLLRIGRVSAEPGFSGIPRARRRRQLR